MKLKKFSYMVMALPMVLASCADYFDTANYLVEQPADDARLAYLAEYKPLKEYVNRSAHPGFTLGTGVNADEYLKMGAAYMLTNSNFDMVTTGNAMKYGSIVDNNGNMNFGTVMNFVDAATTAGMQVYGHTLVWHSQQNTKYLNGLIADKQLPADPSQTHEEFVKRECLQVITDDKVSDPWDSQFWINFAGVSFQSGDTWEVSMDVRAKKEASAGTQVHKEPSEYLHWDAIGSVNFTTEWETYKKNGTCSAEWAGGHSIAFNLNDFADANEYYFDNISFKLNGQELVVNGACDFGGSTESYVSKEMRGNLVPSRLVEGYNITVAGAGSVEMDVNRECIQVQTDDMVDAAWDSQFWLSFPGESFHSGDTWEVSMNVRADKDASAGTQVHRDPGDYLHWDAIGSVAFTNDWTTYSKGGTCSAEWEGGHSIAFNLNDFADANTYYFDDISFKLNGRELITNGSCDLGGSVDNFVSKEMRGAIVASRIVDHYTITVAGGGIPLTPEEKYEILDKELQRWITGSMDATEGKVKVWDLVNEPLQDTWGDIPLKTDPSGADPDCFYWQDYLGEDYVVLAEKYAREAFAAQEDVNPADLKLFINDYNLEAAYNNNDKCTSLVNWIKKWEAKGAKIDGIGSQMHVTYCLNAEDQAKNEAAIENMFKILANSGKLIRITELDMGINDEAGNTINTGDVTFEQQQAMGDFYKFIINKYFELIPVDQQFGICQWAQTDSPAGSGWRPDQPIGLWNLNYQRKPQYGKVCEAYENN